MPTETTPGAKLLLEFLRTNAVTQEACADALKVSGSTVHDWLTGAKRPRSYHRDQIAIWTSGAVAADSWERPKEKRALANVAPFKRSGTEG